MDLLDAGIPSLQAVVAQYLKSYTFRQSVELYGGIALCVACVVLLVAAIFGYRKERRILPLTALLSVSIVVAGMAIYTLWNRGAHTVRLNEEIVQYVKETETVLRGLQDANTEMTRKMAEIVEILKNIPRY